MLPCDFKAKANGRAAAEKRQAETMMQVLAVHAAWVINHTAWGLKFAVQPSQLLGPSFGGGKGMEFSQEDWDYLKSLEAN